MEVIKLSGMDYYGPMVQTHRLLTVALAVALLAATATGQAQPVAASGPHHSPRSPAQPVASAALDAEVFYEVLLGEITNRAGDPGAGYALMLEAARRSNDEKLYQRAADIAIAARSGESALAAANAWKAAWPASREANRYVLQVLIALNRIAETIAPLKQELTQTAPHSKTDTLQALPQMYRNASDKTLAASVVEQALESDLRTPEAAGPAWIAIARMRMLANDKKGALEAAEKAQKIAPNSDGPALLGLSLLETGDPAAEQLLRRYFDGSPKPAMRVTYARVLVDLQRYPESLQQLQAATREAPDLAEAWLMQAALQFQQDQLAPSEASLQRFIALAQAPAASEAHRAGLTQAYLLYSQIAEKRNDLDGAQAWLDRIDGAADAFRVQIRRAALLARQGKLEQARALIQGLPAATPDDERLKLLADVQLLRDAGQYDTALAAQGKVVAQFPEDNDLVYDQAMLAEKAGKPELMEHLLRQIIARQPDYHHAYNALGYSLADRGQHLEEAKKLIQKALSYAPEDPFIQDSLGWVEFRLGHSAEAVRILEAAFKRRPDAEIAAHLGEVLWSMGEQNRAKTVWQEGLRRNADSEPLRETLKRLGVSL